MSSRIPKMTNAEVMNIFKNPTSFQALSFVNKARVQHRVGNMNNSITGLSESTHIASRPSSTASSIASSYSPLMRKNRKSRKGSRRANRKSRRN